MIKELVVHLGDTKTGSTSIQNALLQNACQGAGATIFYPGTSHHNALVRTLVRKQQFSQRSARFGRINKALNNSDADIGVISAEHFQMVHPDRFAEAVEEHLPVFYGRMRLIAYVRPHAEKLLSAFSERVKLGYHTGSFEAFLDKIEASRELIYLPRFAAWRDRFGLRFELRPFVRHEMFRSDPVADFFRVVLGHEDFSLDRVVSSNTSLTLSQMALLRDLQSRFQARAREQDQNKGQNKGQSKGQKLALPLQDAGATMGRTVAEHMRDHGVGNDEGKPRIPAALAPRILDLYRDDAAALDAAFFEGNPMSDALEDLDRLTVAEPQSLAVEDYMTPGEIAGMRAFGAILSKMALSDPRSFQKMAMGTRLMFSGTPEG